MWSNAEVSKHAGQRVKLQKNHARFKESQCCFGGIWGEFWAERLFDRPGGTTINHNTHIRLHADEYGFHAESHKEALMDKINEHDNFR